MDSAHAFATEPEITPQERARRLREAQLEAQQQAVIARIAQRHELLPAYTTEDLRLIPPCPVCGGRGKIEDGRLSFHHNWSKHYPPPPPKEAAPTPVPAAVQRSFDEADGPDNWYR